MTTSDWITPKNIIFRLGQFDLDPCESLEQPWRCAERGFTEIEDGLSQPWEGRVWLNPPYGKETQRWVKRLAEHGNGTALIFARTDTQWFFEQVWSRAHEILFIEGRVKFHRPNGKLAGSSGGAPSVLVAYGASDVMRLRASGIPGAYVGDWAFRYGKDGA